jgi:tetratricopeptide (TPR) repeat protein
LLHRSHLENLVQCGKYDLAEQQVNDWQMPPAPSPMEWSILPSRTITSSKVFRSQGDFAAAQERLEICLKVLKGHEQVASQVLCQLLDIYSDLELPQMAAELIAPEIEKWRKKAPKSKALRRILVSSIDISLQRENYHDVNKTIEELSGTFEGLQKLDISDELLHIRLLIASARIHYLSSDFSQAVQRWKIALNHVQKYASFNGEGFTYAVIHLSLSLAYLKMDQSEMAAISFGQGQRILCQGKRDYWIPTLPAWFGFVASEMQAMGWFWQEDAS